MLFSDDKIAQFVNDHFEPAWQNVRSVPMVTIDFGGGHVLTRTLNGNIATHVCTSDGQVLDILPGIYEPETFQYELNQFAKLYKWVRQDDQDLVAAITKYHQLQAKALAEEAPPLHIGPLPNFSKYRIERATKLALMPKPDAGERELSHADDKSNTAVSPKMSSNDELARWDVLIKDTQVNQSHRRRVIHEYLAEATLPSPNDMMKWLYRDVLDADLDDPYLGLGKTLFANYPFHDG